MKPNVIDHERRSIRAELMKLRSRTGILSPEKVVGAAKAAASPLHKYFEWSDSEAAAQYRLIQAEALIRRVKITIVNMDKKKPVTIGVTRVFQSRLSARGRGGSYESIDDILSNPRKRRELLEQAIQEIEAYQSRYGILEELSALWEAKAKIEMRFGRRKKAA